MSLNGGKGKATPMTFRYVEILTGQTKLGTDRPAPERSTGVSQYTCWPDSSNSSKILVAYIESPHNSIQNGLNTRPSQGFP
jgi:hypothetical protein